VDYLVFKNFFVCLTFLTCSLNSCQKCDTGEFFVISDVVL